MDTNQKEELKKFYSTKKIYNSIIKTSKDSQQIKRANQSLLEIEKKMQILFPEGIPEDHEVERMLNESTLTNTNWFEAQIKSSIMLKEFPVLLKKESGQDIITALKSMLAIWEDIFLPTLAQSHVKLEYTLTHTREGHYKILDELKRLHGNIFDASRNLLSKKYDDEQKKNLQIFKSRNVDEYIKEGIGFLKNSYEFWNSINVDLNKNHNACLNPQEKIYYDKKFESTTIFEGYTVLETIQQTTVFLEEAIKILENFS